MFFQYRQQTLVVFKWTVHSKIRNTYFSSIYPCNSLCGRVLEISAVDVCRLSNIMELWHFACGAQSAKKLNSNVYFHKSWLKIIHRYCEKQFHVGTIFFSYHCASIYTWMDGCMKLIKLTNFTAQQMKMPLMFTSRPSRCVFPSARYWSCQVLKVAIEYLVLFVCSLLIC